MWSFAKDYQFVIDLVEQHDPDVICLQEVVGGREEQFVAWLESKGYKWRYNPFGYSEKRDLSQGVFVAAKSSLNPEIITTHLRKTNPRPFRNFENTRELLSVKVGDKTIINAHYTVARPYTVDLRREEFEDTKKYLRGIEGDWCVMGDFNFFGLDYRRRWLKKNCNFHSIGGLKSTWRWVKYLPVRLKLDAVVWNKDSKMPVDVKFLDYQVSDHRPFIVEIT